MTRGRSGGASLMHAGTRASRRKVSVRGTLQLSVSKTLFLP